MGAPDPIVSIVVVAYGGGWDWLAEALAALRKETQEPYELIVVDNGPAEVVPEDFRSDFGADAMIRNQENVGYGAACNQGVAEARAPFVCFLNPDVFVCPQWLSPLLA